MNTRTEYTDFANRLIVEPGVQARHVQLADLARNGAFMGAPEAGVKIARRRLEEAAERGNATAIGLLAEITEGTAR